MTVTMQYLYTAEGYGFKPCRKEMFHQLKSSPMNSSRGSNVTHLVSRIGVMSWMHSSSSDGSHVNKYPDFRALIEKQPWNSYLELYSIKYPVGPLGVVAPSS